MSDVGLGQDVTVTGKYRARKLKQANIDSMPAMKLMEEMGAIKRIAGGETITDPGKTAQNNTVGWVGEGGRTSLQDGRVIDSPEQDWRYLLGGISWTLADEYKNSGGSDTRFVDLISGKYEVLEETMKNKYHEGLLSAGTSDSGLQLSGFAAAIPTVNNSGTYCTINRALAAAAWYRTQKFDTGGDWSEGAVDVGNAIRFLDKLINLTMISGQIQLDAFLAGQTHFEMFTNALDPKQVINDQTSMGKSGFDKIFRRGVPIFYGGGINYSGFSSMTATRTYGFCFKPGGLALYFHKEAEFELLDELQSSDQPARSRMMFCMSNLFLGPLAKRCIVGFD